MNGKFGILVLMITAASFMSCKKCIECKAEDGPSGMSSDKKEYCGNKADRDAFQTNWMSMQTAAGYKNVSCD